MMTSNLFVFLCGMGAGFACALAWFAWLAWHEDQWLRDIKRGGRP